MLPEQGIEPAAQKDQNQNLTIQLLEVQYLKAIIKI